MAWPGTRGTDMANVSMASVNTGDVSRASSAEPTHHEKQEELGMFGAVTEGASRPQVSLRRHRLSSKQRAPLCAGCRAKEARYGFLRDGDDPTTERPQTLCFECFRVELGYRQDINARLARGWNASQVPLPLEDKLNELTR